MSVGQIAGAGLVAGGIGAAFSSTGARQAGHDLRDQLGPSNDLQLELLKQRVRSAQALDDMAQKLESGDPLSPQEAQFLDSVFQRTNVDIGKSREATTREAIGTQAGIGFLRSGRTAKQIRRINVDAESSRDQNALNRENTALNRAFERLVTIPAQLRQGILTGATGAGQTIAPQSNSSQFLGQALTGLGSAGISFAGQKSAANTSNAAMAQLLKSINNPNASSIV